MATRNDKIETESNGSESVTITKGRTGSWSNDPDREAKNAAHLEAMEKPTANKKPDKPFVLPTLDLRRVSATLIGDESLIVHKWSEKAKKMMLDKQMGIPNEGRENKDPHQDYLDSLYTLPGGKYGFPTIAFKNAAVEACTSLGKGITKVAARQAFHVVGDLVEVHGKPTMREDMVVINKSTADIRYRGEFMPWWVTIIIRYNARVLTDQQIFNLLNTAGFAVGVGEWRSECDGNHGLFHVASAAELKKLGIKV